MINKPYYDIDISSNQWIIESLRSYSDSEMPTAPCRSRWFRVRTAGHRNCSCGYHCIPDWLLHCYYYYYAYAIIIIITIIIAIWYYIYIYYMYICILYTNVPMIITQWHECSLKENLRLPTCGLPGYAIIRRPGAGPGAGPGAWKNEVMTMTIPETEWGLSLL